MVTIIKYNAGNVQSVMFALDRIGVSYVYTDRISDILAAERIIFPGVGEASTAMESLRASGLDRVLPTLKQPFLGTCIGMQLMCRSSEENTTKCLGVFDIEVKRIPNLKDIKVPQTGWNQIQHISSPLLAGIAENSYVYYNNAYYAPKSNYTVATTTHGIELSGALHKENFYAAQFHAEISGKTGQKIFENFMKIQP